MLLDLKARHIGMSGHPFLRNKQPAKRKSTITLTLLDLIYEPMLKEAFFYLDLDNNDTILDLGCGKGHIANELSKRCANSVGIDINLDRLQKASNEYQSILFIRGDIQELPFKSSSFDKIFSCSVLQYVNWPTVIKECERVLKPNGKAVFIEN